jgi:allantoicase
VDTAFFDGNHSPLTSLWACEEGGEGADERVRTGAFKGAGWVEVLPKSECGASRRQAWKFADGSGVGEKRFTHVKVGMWPDGGIARLRVYGHAVPVAFDVATMGSEEVELSAATNGGLAVKCSDQHFGVMSNLLLPGRGKDMGDGWETARNRGVGHSDWVVVRLGMQGVVERVVVDTKDFRGNFPRGVRVEGWVFKEGEQDPGAEEKGWVELLGEQKCQADTEHKFDVGALAGDKVFSHVKLTILPDGGVKRFRVFGRRRG